MILNSNKQNSLRWRAYELDRILQKKFMREKHFSMIKMVQGYLLQKETKTTMITDVLERIIMRREREALDKIKNSVESAKAKYTRNLLDRLHSIYFRRLRHAFGTIDCYAREQNFNPWFEKAVLKLTADAPLCLQTTYWKMKKTAENDIKERT